MPIQSLLAPVDQARSLCAFLADADHQLPPDVAEAVVRALDGTDKQAAQQLRAILSGHGVQIKHMHSLKAVNVIRGTREYRAAGQVAVWEVASWFDDAPGCSPMRHSSSSLGTAADEFIKALSTALDEESEFLYAQVAANDHAVELTFLGEPIGHQHWLLACTDGQGNPAPFLVEQQAKFVERVRRTVEGRHDGWVDGVFALQALHLRSSSYIYLESVGQSQARRYESEIVEVLEKRAQPAPAGAEEFTHDISVGNAKLTGEHRFKLLARYHAWSNRYDATLADLIAMRLKENSSERFARKQINVAIAQARIDELRLESGDIAKLLAISPQALNDCMLAGEMPVALLAQFASILRLPANSLYSEENFRSARMPIDAATVAMTLSRFPHVEVETDPRYGTPKQLEDKLDALCEIDLAQRQRDQGTGPSTDLLALAEALEVADAQFCLRINPQFVPDLPLGRERLAQIATLSIVYTAIINQIPDQSVDTDDDADEPWTSSDDTMLERLNAANIQPIDLINVAKEHASMIDSGSEHGYESTMFATVRVFKGRPNHAHAAQVRMEEMSRLMRNGDLPGWSTPSFEGGDMVMASRPMFAAAAVCPLVRVGKRLGFDVRTFRLHMIKNADQNFVE